MDRYNKRNDSTNINKNDSFVNFYVVIYKIKIKTNTKTSKVALFVILVIFVIFVSFLLI